jgi:murein L,D-transpeptidase YcbB/YkuD
MDSIGALVDLARTNRADVEKVIAQFGGIGNVLQAAPSLLRIMMTISRHKDPVNAANEAADTLTLYYDEATQRRVADFQRKHGLKADGIVGQRTWAVVEKILLQVPDEE